MLFSSSKVAAATACLLLFVAVAPPEVTGAKMEHHDPEHDMLLVGGVSEQPVTDAVEEVARWAVSRLHGSGHFADKGALTLDKVLNSRSQLVAGMRYYITLQLKVGHALRHHLLGKAMNSLGCYICLPLSSFVIRKTISSMPCPYR